MTELLDIVKNCLPERKQSYYLMLLVTIEKLSEPLGNKPLDKFLSSTGIRSINLGDATMAWPEVIKHNILQDLKEKQSIDQYLEVFRKSGFGYFLSYTKSLSIINSQLREKWNTAYDQWNEFNVALLQPYIALNQSASRELVTNIVNEIIVLPEEYHENSTRLKGLIKRHYRLMLAEKEE